MLAYTFIRQMTLDTSQLRSLNSCWQLVHCKIFDLINGSQHRNNYLCDLVWSFGQVMDFLHSFKNGELPSTNVWSTLCHTTELCMHGSGILFLFHSHSNDSRLIIPIPMHTFLFRNYSPCRCFGDIRSSIAQLSIYFILCII